MHEADGDVKGEPGNSSEMIELSSEKPEDKKCPTSKTDFRSQNNYTG